MDLKLHHIGVVVKDVAAAAAEYAERFGYEIRSEVVHDPAQTAFVQFLSLPGDTGFLELVAPDGESSKLSNALSKGGGLNHLCYSVVDIDAACREMRSRGLRLIQRPAPAVAFSGRRIAWLIGRDSIPVELVERGPGDEP